MLWQMVHTFSKETLAAEWHQSKPTKKIKHGTRPSKQSVGHSFPDQGIGTNVLESGATGFDGQVPGTGTAEGTGG